MVKKRHASLSPDKLRHRADPEQFSFKTTDDMPELLQFIGQDRALKACTFGVGMTSSGFNIFALGPQGQGKRSVILALLKGQATRQKNPPDICYIHNFTDPKSPKVIMLAPGLGKTLASDMRNLIEILRTEIPALFESKAYTDRMKEIQEDIRKNQESTFSTLEKEAMDNQITILRTPQGLVLALIKDNKIISEEDFASLPAEERAQKEILMDRLRGHLESYLEQLPQWQKELREKVKDAMQYFTMLQVGSIFSQIKKKYQEHEVVRDYLSAVEQAILDNPNDFRKKPEGYLGLLGIETAGDHVFNRYGVNVLVDNGQTAGAPVIFEDNPTFSNLIGRIDHVSQFGALVTDFTLIRAGALHNARGGYLILNAHKLLVQPYAYEGLKRALRAKKITIENINQLMGFMGSVSIEPEPVPLDVKVVLIGERNLYYLLCSYDPEFLELFKVAADFDETIERSVDNNLRFAQLLKNLGKTEGLRPLTKHAVAEVIDYASSLIGDQKKMSTHVGRLTDLLREANYCASLSNSNAIEQSHIEKAIVQQIERASRIKEERQKYIERGLILIDTAGSQVGQVNGLSVIELAGFMFGQPTRISARVGMGRGGLIDIEREVKLGGPIHSKGVLILSGYLSGQFKKKNPLSASISLVFEQSYGGVEGDSASIAEAAAILSALADVPIKQSLAITGSMNQHGHVQAVGGINEKILGFFEIVRKREFKEPAGVIIPEANVDQLMLHKDIIEAVIQNRFHIYPVKTIDEAMTILTDIPAGLRSSSGQFSKNSINYRVEETLTKLSRAMKSPPKK